MRLILLISLFYITLLGCGESEETINDKNSIEADSLQLPESQLIIEDSIRKHNYKGKGIRE